MLGLFLLPFKCLTWRLGRIYYEFQEETAQKRNSQRLMFHLEFDLHGAYLTKEIFNKTLQGRIQEGFLKRTGSMLTILQSFF